MKGFDQLVTYMEQFKGDTPSEEFDKMVEFGRGAILFIILGFSLLILIFFYLDFHYFQIQSTILGAIRVLLIIPAVLGLLAVLLFGELIGLFLDLI